MIYVDGSVVLAQLLAQDRTPPESLWQQPLILLECEVWNRINARGLGRSHRDPVQALIARVAPIELARPVLERA
jgi:hypothetical protein